MMENSNDNNDNVLVFPSISREIQDLSFDYKKDNLINKFCNEKVVLQEILKDLRELLNGDTKEDVAFNFKKLYKKVKGSGAIIGFSSFLEIFVWECYGNLDDLFGFKRNNDERQLKDLLQDVINNFDAGKDQDIINIEKYRKNLKDKLE